MAKNRDLLKNVTYYLHKHLFGVDTDAGEDFLNGRAFGVFMSPGQFLNPGWQEGNLEHMYSQAGMLDEVLSAAFIYTPQVGSMSGLYRNITRNAELPKSTLTVPQEQELDRLAKIITEGKPAYTAYEGYYYDAFSAYEQERAKQQPDQSQLARLMNRKTQAWRDWNNPKLGKKAQIDRANADMAAIYRGAPQNMWLELEDLIKNYERTAASGTYYETRLVPPVSSWAASSTSWAGFTQTIDETEIHQYSKTTEWSGSLGARWGLFNSVNVGANGAKTVTHDTSEITAIKVAFEYMRVRIHRPWMDQNVFTYPFWTWNKNTSGGYLSNGGAISENVPQAPRGTMPFLPTSLIVVRNVVISADFKTSDIQTMNSRISGGVSAGFGPFSVRGSYTETTNQVDVRATFDGTTLTIPNPQVIGFQGTLLPRTPNPDISLPFDWERAWKPSDDRLTSDADAFAEEFAAKLTDASRKYEELKLAVNVQADTELMEKYDAYLRENGL